jgi:hypothetical protein
LNERRALEADFITAHPGYDKTLWIFSNRNRFRKFCQLLVEPGYGERIFGVPAHPRWKLVFDAIIFSAIVGSVVVAGIAAPVFRYEYTLANGDVRLSWFNLTEVSLGLM